MANRIERRRSGRAPVRALSLGLALGAFLLQAIAVPVGAYPRPGHLERFDVATSGATPSGTCQQYSSLSENGRFAAFDTDRPLVAGDINMKTDIYLRDFGKGTTELISEGLLGGAAVGPSLDEGGDCTLSRDPSITPDGRYVAFWSTAVNLVPGDTNRLADVFIHDRLQHRMERVSVNSQEEEQTSLSSIPGDSVGPSVSADGRFVSFTSFAGNLVDDDTNDYPDVFVRDRRRGTTRRVSVDSQGNQSDPCPSNEEGLPLLACYAFAGGLASSLSLNGRYVAFTSRSPDLVSEDTNGIFDVFVHDLKTRVTERVSVASDGTESQDIQGNRANGTLRLGSTFHGKYGWDAARTISADGRFIVFASTATNLVPNDTNRHGAGTAYLFPGGGDAFVHDRRTGRTERVSVASDGREQMRCSEATACWAGSPGISANGRFVSFLCWNACEVSLPTRDPEEGSDVAVFDRRTGELRHAPLTEQQIKYLSDPDAFGFALGAGNPDISPSGRFVSFAAHQPYDEWGSADAFFRYDRGVPLGRNSWGGRERRSDESGDHESCITSYLCVPRKGSIVKRDSLKDLPATAASMGADIINASVAYRPQLEDLYLRLDVSEMGPVRTAPAAGVPLTLYGFFIETNDALYQVRAALTVRGSNLQPAFGLFRCDDDTCTETNWLHGGWGTRSEGIVTSLPLDSLGLGGTDRISRVTAFTAQGSYFADELTILDELELR